MILRGPPFMLFGPRMNISITFWDMWEEEEEEEEGEEEEGKSTDL